MRKLGKGITGAVAVAALVGMGVAGGAAFQSSVATEVANNENVTIVYTSAAGGPVVLSGLVNDTGTDAAGKSNDTLTLSEGSFVVHHVSTEGGGVATENETTCIATITDAGTFTINKNGRTGAYTKLKGSGTYTASGTFVFPVNANGFCRFGTAPLHGVETLKATGALSFGGSTSD
jgi:hypothetical protein